MCRDINHGGRRCPQVPLTTDERKHINELRREQYSTSKEKKHQELVESLKGYTFDSKIHSSLDDTNEAVIQRSERFKKLKLKEDELKAIYDYTTMDFKKIRQNLSRYDVDRNVSVSFPKAKRELLQKKVQILDSIMAKVKPSGEPTILFRGGDIPEYEDPAEWVSKNFIPGQVWVDKTYLSTSADVHIATCFPNKEVKEGHTLMFEIISNGGLPIPAGATFMNGEHEVLFPRKNKFIVAEVIPEHNYEWYSVSATVPDSLTNKNVTLIRLIDTNLPKGVK